MNQLTAQSLQSTEKNSYRRLSQNGFTLIELMVVIAIIAILAVVGAVIFSGVQQRGRDSKRLSDISAIAKALETKKGQTVATYSTVAAADFSEGIPTDSTTAKYCLIQATTKTVPGLPTAWTATDACPTAPAGYAAFTGALLGTTQSWRICALQETTSSPQWICKASSQ